MTINLDTLRKTAEAATPGPWTHEPYEAQNQNGDYFGGWLLDADGEYVVADVSDRDGAFMAAANPETVLALLSRVEKAEQAVQRVREALRDREYDEPGHGDIISTSHIYRALAGDGRG